MTTFRGVRRAAVAALFLSALSISLTPSAVADVIEPPLPVEYFPSQVKEACAIWKELDWPKAARPTDYAVVNTSLVIRGSNVYGNRSGDLPRADEYREYDVNPRPRGQRRDAERLVRDPATHAVWYTYDHYDNFQEISEGCS
ncbi:ribonuclease domain-containing protein [Streptomyces paludis]|uniref:Guanine-specific ribonuclease N1 and T1 n=1 Tax=Streptomyces paludis TaxID=2282738 RepID=A0A345HKF6_9ACTN|nr:ribonuclease domain-containing protein [Streptomyces paludis]AXG77180.1 guanine-specific ribonuclease N1 and T1 [Streptomyces paludis]